MATSTYRVERSTTIDAPPEAVYPHIEDFRRWTSWSPWEGLDPNMSRTYTGPDRGAGSAYSWTGNRKAGAGRMTITEASTPSRVAIDLQFDKPFKSRSDTVFTVEPHGSGSRVTWSMTGPMSLGTRIMSLVKSMDALVGPDFEKGLARLKLAAETTKR
jgi:hypothetical protein